MEQGNGNSGKSGTKRLVFVCTGNTCRSPMAEVLFRKYLNDNRLGEPAMEIDVSSAGLHSGVGASASVHAKTVAKEYGADLTGHRSRPMTDHLAFTATWLVTMTSSHADELLERFPCAHDKVHVIGEFLGRGAVADVPDPFGGTLADYRECAATISSAFDNMATYITRLS